MSQDIQRTIKSLIQQGESLRAQLSKIKDSSLTMGDEFLKDALTQGAKIFVRDVIGLSGGGRYAKKYTKAYLNKQQERQMVEAENIVDKSFISWFQTIQEFFSTISIKKTRLQPSGNSDTLLRKLDKVLTYKRLDTKIRHTLNILLTFLNQPLIFNKDIPQFLKTVQVEKKKQAKEIVIPPQSPFTGSRELKNVFENVDGYVKIIDPFVGEETLDLLINIPEKISILLITSFTGGKNKERRLKRACKKFKIEKPEFEIRKCDPKLIHDRFILTRSKGWSVGTSLKDIGRKLSMINEISPQTKAEMETIFEQIWNKARNLLA